MAKGAHSVDSGFMANSILEYEEYRGDTRITRRRLGKLTVTCESRPPSDQACKNFARVLDEVLGRIVDQPNTNGAA